MRQGAAKDFFHVGMESGIDDFWVTNIQMLTFFSWGYFCGFLFFLSFL